MTRWSRGATTIDRLEERVDGAPPRRLSMHIVIAAPIGAKLEPVDERRRAQSEVMT